MGCNQPRRDNAPAKIKDVCIIRRQPRSHRPDFPGLDRSNCIMDDPPHVIHRHDGPRAA